MTATTDDARRSPARHGPRPWTVLAIAALGILSIVASGNAVAPVFEQRGPDDVVREYLEAIASGDAEAANALADPGIDEPSEAPLLTNAALATAVERPSDIVVEPDFENVDYGEPIGVGSVVEVDASYLLGGARTDVTLEVERGADVAGFPFAEEQWTLRSGIVGRATIASTTDVDVTVSTVPVSLDRTATSEWATVQSAYPAIYRVDGTDSIYTSTPAVNVEVMPENDYPTLIILAPEPTARLVMDLETQLTDMITACVEGTWRRTQDCTDMYLWTDQLTISSVTPPTVSRVSGGGFEATGGSIEYVNSDDPDDVGEITLYVSGSYEINGDTLIITGVG